MTTKRRQGRRGPVIFRRAVVLYVVGGAALAVAGGRAFGADVTLPPISVGAGLQTGFEHEDPGASGTTSTDRFYLDSIRLYLNGSVTDNIKVTFNTEYTTTNDVQVLDAIARFEFSDSFNIWAGRLLPPSDRANLYGPYYANDWFPYADGVADFYPSVATGRDNGVAYWGQFGIVKVSAGLFDGPSASGTPTGTGAGNDKMISAARVMVDFWSPEPGYYLNGTYYGEKDILALGVAAQNQASDTSDGGTSGGTASSIDGLLEKKLGDSGVVDVESEYQHDSGLIDRSNGWYGLASYLLPQPIGVGKVQFLGKYSEKTTHALTDIKDKTKEIEVNYIIKGFNARVGAFYLNYDDPTAPCKAYGVKLQLQM